MKEALESTGLKVFGGENAPYLWVKAPGEVNSWKFFEQMLYEANVVGTPGVGFGPSGEGYIRLTAFGERADCEEAMKRIRKMVALSNTWQHLEALCACIGLTSIKPIGI